MAQGNGQQIVKPQGGGIARQGFGSQELEQRAETASTALAERAKAEVQARYIVALQRPRDIDDVRVRMLKHCGRFKFAEGARYKKPVGRDRNGNQTYAEGPSIRLIETALQEYGNVMPECAVAYDDADKRVVRVSVTDLERNITHTKEIQVPKTKEIKNSKGREVISSRINSYGDTTYLVTATDDEVLTTQAALESKALRALGAKILPADLLEEAEDRCRDSVQRGIENDPDAARKSIADAFAKLGVMPGHLKEYLGHELDQASPAQLKELRDIWSSINSGEASWRDFAAADEGDAEEGKSSKKSKGAEVLEKRRKAREQSQGSGESAAAKAEESKPKKSKDQAKPAPEEQSAPAKTEDDPAWFDDAPVEDELAAEIRDLETRLGRVLQEPGELPELMGRVEKLPEGEDRERLLKLCHQAGEQIDAAEEEG